MVRLFLFITISFLVSVNGNSQIKDLFNKAKNTAAVLSGDESKVSEGLKEALNHGIDAAVQQLSAENGYFESPYKVLIPQDAQKVIDKVKMIPGFEDVEKKLIKQMNQAAEIAAKKATPIFVDAIKKMSFKDAKQILSGSDDAATTYLQSTSRKQIGRAHV